MAINYEKWQNRWSSNEVIVLVLLSLGMQICLIVLAPLRKRSKNTVLKLTLWLLYLTADSVAILALGNISNQDDPAESGDSGTMPSKLTVLWAPFLLVHLGGPDSITSYSVEDNELWWRHLLGLFVQVVVTVYVFWQSPPKGLMWIPTMLVFIPGLIKFAERTHALRLGSKDNLKDKIISELGLGNDTDKVLQSDNNDNTTSNADDPVNGTTKDSNDNPTSNPVDPANGTTKDSNDNTTSNPVDPANGTTKGIWGTLKDKILVLFPAKDTKDSNDNPTSNPVDPANRTTKDSNDNTTSNPVDQPNGTTKVKPSNREKESEDICDGYEWFNKFKRLLVDVTFSSNLLMQSQDHFSGMEAKDALNLVAIELSFMYDILHTKAGHMHNNSGRVLRCFSLVSIIAALVVFHHLDMQKYASKDIIITYILFGVGLIIEVIAVVLLVSSDWTVVSLTNKGWKKSIACAITSMVKGITFQKGKIRWSRNIGQFNLVGLCLRDRYTPDKWIMKKLNKLKHIWDNMRESSTIPLPELFEQIMFTEAKRRAQNVHIYNVLLEARSYRGGKALERHGQLKNLDWSLKREFDESIILWHVATDICYYKKEPSNQPNGENQEPSNQPNGDNQEPSNQPNGENQEPCNQPNGENQEPSNQPNGRKNCWSLPKRKKQPKEKIDTERDVSWKTSNYMVYLLTQQQSMMQLGYGKTRFEATCAVVKKKFKGKGKLEDKNAREELIKKDEPAAPVLEQNDAQVSADGRQPTDKKDTFVLKQIWAALRCWGRCKREEDKHRRKREEDKRKREEDKRKREDEMGKLLRDSLRLADELQKVDQQIRWKLISETWMEMLGYAAIHCDSYQHAKSLRRGGELLTHLWLLMSQLGVVEEHKMQQYQSGTV